MIIVPTRVCNTNSCNYCGVYKKDFDYNYFNNFLLDDFYKKITLLAEKSNDYELRFFGGEPLIRFDLIKKIITFFKKQNNKFSFIINTNLSIISENQIQFIKENNIKLIISCNGNVETHTKTRGISILETIKLYENIKKITHSNIEHQINIVVNQENAKNLKENINFIENTLGAKNINLLPVNYNKNGWTEKGLEDLENSFNLMIADINEFKLKIHFINKDINNKVPLFNSELVIDSDGNIYPSMVILEYFFLNEKEKIIISNLDNSFENLLGDLIYYEEENNKIYSFYINKVLKSKFPDIMENDNKAGLIFHNFLEKI